MGSLAVVAAAVWGGERLRYIVGVGVLGVTICGVGAVIIVQQRKRHLALSREIQSLRSSLTATVAKRIDETLRADTRIAANVAREVAQIEAVTALYHRLDIADELPALQGFAAAPDVLVTLYDLVRNERPGLILECGSGASTVVLARAVQRNGGGRVMALEHSEHHVHATRSMVERASLGDIATVIHAPLIEHQVGHGLQPWYDLERAGDVQGIGLAFIDGPPTAVGPRARYPALPVLASSLEPGALVVVDDAARDDDQATLARWVEDFDLETISTPNLTRGAVVMRFRGMVGSGQGVA